MAFELSTFRIVFEIDMLILSNFPVIFIVYQCYNYFHNILSLFDVLPNFSLTTSETMRHFYV